MKHVTITLGGYTGYLCNYDGTPSEWTPPDEWIVKDGEPAKPPPEIPPEVHNTRPIDPARCVAATKALCS